MNTLGVGRPRSWARRVTGSSREVNIVMITVSLLPRWPI